MSAIEREHLPIIRAFVELLAERCDKFADRAGVGGAETVGHLISYLDERPEDLEPWLNGGFMELPPDWLVLGNLTYHGGNGKIWHPRDARYSRIVRKLAAGGEHQPKGDVG